MWYVFGDYTLDAEHYELHRAGTLVRLEPRVFNLLAYLVRHPGRTVTKEELREQLWPDQPFMSDDPLANSVAQARKALGDSGQAQRYIKTMHGRGYCFMAPVEVRQQPEMDVRLPPAAAAPQPSGQGGLGHADVGSPPAVVFPAPLSVPPPAHSTAPAPPAAEPDLPAVERRQLTVLACRLVGVAARAEPLDPEVLLEVVQDYHAMCAQVVHRFDGYIAQDQGDTLVVYFGYPRAHEDDARRAVHAALGMVERVAERTSRQQGDRGVRLAVCIGIHMGLMVVGGMGHGAQSAPLALGTTPTIAAQLQDLAAPDTVLISPAAWRLVEGYFGGRAVGAHVLEEGAAPLVVYQILQARPVQSRFEVAVAKGLTPMVGREHEVGLLRAHWRQATDGLGQVVLLSGEAGIGKSRLVQVLKEHLTGEAHTRIECQCWPAYQHTAFYPVVTYLQRFLQFTREEPVAERLRKLEDALAPYGFARAEVVPLLAALLLLPPPAQYSPLTLTPERQKQKTLDTLLAWLLQEAERQPVCVVMEDLHWGDPSTLEWLSLLIDQIPMARVLLLLTCRPEFRPPWTMQSHHTHLALSRLSPRQTAGMIGQVVGGKSLPAEVVQHVVAITDGVPLFIEELTKMVVESGLVQEREGQYELAGPLPPLAIPATLHDSLMARLDRLGPAKQVAQLGATVGRKFSYEVLCAVSSVDAETLRHALTQLVAAELLYQRGLPPQARYRFKHALIQEAAYASLLRSTRRQYHQRIAQVLEERFPETRETQPELLAHHYTEAGGIAQAMPYWQRAGQQASERSAYREAIAHCTKGLALLQTLPDTPERAQHELILQLTLRGPLTATQGEGAPEVERALTRARELCQQVGETAQLFAVLQGLSTLYFARAELQKARELGEQCLTLAKRVDDPAYLARAHSALGVPLYWSGELTPARIHLEQAIALSVLLQSRSQASPRRIVDGRITALSYVALALWLLGYPDQAVKRSNEALTLAQAQSLPHSLVFALALQSAASLHQLRREVQAAQVRAEAVIALSTEQGFMSRLAAGTVTRGWALAEQGQGEVGIAQIRQGIAALQATGTAMAGPRVLALLAVAYGHVGQTEEGLHVLTEALTVVDKTGQCLYAAEIYRLKGVLTLRQCPVASAKGQAPMPQPLPPNSQAEVEAETYFQQAIEIARWQRAKSLELRAVMSLSRLWQQQGKHAAAHELLAPVYGWFTEGFDTADIQEAKALLEELEA
jgi:DNA-binding winged helix-turn-helix (wHTH) protein/class 3 adenylate cyclase/tetratricopeptide (TPR) repeat protein